MHKKGILDGVSILDPANPLVRRDGQRNASLVLVPGKESALYGAEKVPHGNLAKVWYDSPTLGMQRRMYIYTPPGYEKGDMTYPVLYLLHGGGGDDRLAYQGSQTLAEELKKLDMPYKFRESSGGHTWANWRIYLSEMAPMLFK